MISERVKKGNLGIKIFFIFFFIPFLVRAENVPSYKIATYQVEVKPDIATKSISGSVKIELKITKSEDFTLPTNGLILDKVTTDKKQIKAEINQETITIKASGVKVGTSFNLLVRYHGTPKKGLRFGKDFVYTDFDTCYWMICADDPSMRAKFKIDIIVPKGFLTTASGNFVSQKKVSAELVRHRWRESKPFSAYLFGFAAGKFHEASVKARNTYLRYLGVTDNEASLLKKFKDTQKALEFFERKSGVPIHHKIYTQVLVPTDEAQEKNAFAIIGNKFLDPILTDPQEDWVFVHELAHQWWGNLLTCKSWQHFWLNEGITVFMTAAYKEERWGKEAYQRELDILKKRHQKAIEAGFDVPLTFSGEYPTLAISRAITYSKGALFMDALRTTMGEKRFWKGLKKYTQKFAYKSVESSDFQMVMEKAYGKSLKSIFMNWVAE